MKIKKIIFISVIVGLILSSSIVYLIIGDNNESKNNGKDNNLFFNDLGYIYASPDGKSIIYSMYQNNTLTFISKNEYGNTSELTISGFQSNPYIGITIWSFDNQRDIR